MLKKSELRLKKVDVSHENICERVKVRASQGLKDGKKQKSRKTDLLRRSELCKRSYGSFQILFYRLCRKYKKPKDEKKELRKNVSQQQTESVPFSEFSKMNNVKVYEGVDW